MSRDICDECSLAHHAYCTGCECANDYHKINIGDRVEFTVRPGVKTTGIVKRIFGNRAMNVSIEASDNVVFVRMRSGIRKV